MRASVIIVVFNGIKHLSVCLPALIQELQPSDELILLDNHSTDGSAEYIQRNYPAIKLVKSETNLGFAAGCNRGAQLATGEYLVFLNQDTQVQPGWLSGLLEPLVNPRIGLTTSLAVAFDAQNIILSCGNNIHFTGLSFARHFGKSSDNSRPERVQTVQGASFAISRQLWELLGGFDENFFMYYEETDLCWRAQSLGYECWLAPQSRLAHHHNPVKNASVIYYAERNRRLTVLKNYHWLTLCLIVPSLLLAELLQWINMAQSGKFSLSAKLKADLWLFKNITTIVQARSTLLHSPAIDYKILAQRSYNIEILEGQKNHSLVKFFLPWVNILFRVNHTIALSVLSLFHGN